MTMPTVQDKQKEITFFDAWAASDEYDVFTAESNARLISGGRLPAADKLLRYGGTGSVADAFPAATQLERSLLRDHLEGAVQGLLEP